VPYLPVRIAPALRRGTTGSVDGSYLSPPSCYTPEDCVAVGSTIVKDGGNTYEPAAVVAFHNGHPGPAVQVGPTHGPGLIILLSVGCGGSGACVATGNTYVEDNGTITSELVLVPITNGSPGTPATDSSDPPLSDVTCPLPDDCLAVGYTSSGQSGVAYAINPQTLALSDLGTIPAPGAAGCTGIQANGRPICVVGASSGGTPTTDDSELAVFDGNSFVGDVAGPTLTRRFEGANIRGVSCPSLSLCEVTGGGDGSEGGYFPISISERASGGGGARGNDVVIKVTPGKLKAVSRSAGLGTVACGSEMGCVLGGWTGSGTGIEGELIPLDPETGKIGNPTALPGFGELFGGAFPPGLTVNTTKDQTGSERACETENGECTVRAAFDAINAGARGDALFLCPNYTSGTATYTAPETASVITFSVPGAKGTPVINLAKPLPALKNQVSIDGSTEPGAQDGAPGVQIDGAAAGGSANGIELDGNGSVLNGIVVTGFGGDGVLLKGVSSTVTDSWIGVAAKPGGGYQAEPNADSIEVTGSNETIGGTTASTRDVISGNGKSSELKSLMASLGGKHVTLSKLRTEVIPSGAGVLVRETPVSRLLIEGDYIGLAPDGTELPPGQGNAVGVGILSTGSVSNVAIGANPGGNIITGNTVGVMAIAPSYNALSGLTIEGNLIGTLPDDQPGPDPMGNLLGIMAANVAGLVVGAPGGGTGNTISGDGVGLVVADSKKALVQSDAFGVDAPLLKGFNLDEKGVKIGLHDIIAAGLIDTQGTIFGGGGPGGGDIASSGCGLAGDPCLASGGETASELEGRVNSVVGGQASGSNAYAGSDGPGNRAVGDGIGLMVTGDGKGASSSNVVEGNIFGRGQDFGHPITFEDSHSLEDLGGFLGLAISGSDGNVVADNSFLGNVGGVWAGHSPSAVYQSNIFSSDLWGLLAIASPGSHIGGSGGDGDQNGNIFVRDGFGLILGDGNPGKTEVRAGGLRSGDMQPSQFDTPLSSPAIGDEVATAGAIASEPIDAGILSPKPAPGTDYVVDDNGFGVDGAGTSGLGDVVGAIIAGDVTHAQFAGNAVWNNQKGGLWVVEAAGRSNSVAAYSDSFYNNSLANPSAKEALGLDLWTVGEKGEELGPDGPSSEQPGVGANHLQNAPVITKASVSKAVVTVSGRLESVPNTSYEIDLYASGACNPSGYGDGELLIRQLNVTTGPGGAASFSTTATASDVLAKKGAKSRPSNILIRSNLDATSEFSKCLAAHS